MSIEENKAAARRLNDEVLNKGNLEVVDELIAYNYVARGFAGEDFNCPDGFRQFVNMYRTAFPDFHITIDDMVAEGDRVALRFTWTGTHDGDLMGIAPTGKKVTMTGAAFNRYAGGKNVESLGFADSLALFQQLGVAPPAA